MLLNVLQNKKKIKNNRKTARNKRCSAAVNTDRLLFNEFGNNGAKISRVLRF